MLMFNQMMCTLQAISTFHKQAGFSNADNEGSCPLLTQRVSPNFPGQSVQEWYAVSKF